jgi:hypothetical protein
MPVCRRCVRAGPLDVTVCFQGKQLAAAAARAVSQPCSSRHARLQKTKTISYDATNPPAAGAGSRVGGRQAQRHRARCRRIPARGGGQPLCCRAAQQHRSATAGGGRRKQSSEPCSGGLQRRSAVGGRGRRRADHLHQRHNGTAKGGAAHPREPLSPDFLPSGRMGLAPLRPHPPCITPPPHPRHRQRHALRARGRRVRGLHVFVPAQRGVAAAAGAARLDAGCSPACMQFAPQLQSKASSAPPLVSTATPTPQRTTTSQS